MYVPTQHEASNAGIYIHVYFLDAQLNNWLPRCVILITVPY